MDDDDEGLAPTPPPEPDRFVVLDSRPPAQAATKEPPSPAVKVAKLVQETVQKNAPKIRNSLVKTASSLGIHVGDNGSTMANIRIRVAKVLATRSFDAFTGLVIVCNTISVGVEQSFRIDQKDLSPFSFIENIFLAIYITELSLRMFAHGMTCFQDAWVKFDFFLVVFSIVTDWLLPLVASTEESSPVMMLRMARLARLARALRLLIKFRELWMLVHGFMSSVNMMLYTMVLLGIILYVFSSVGLELITLKYGDKELNPDLPQEFEAIINTYFPNLPLTMLSLVQFVCMDSIGAIYRPLITYDPSLGVYFVLVILTVGIVLMNIITAVLVNGALEQASQDKEAMRAQEEKKRRKLMTSLREMFHRLDEDGSGEVDKHEILAASALDRALLLEFSADVGSDVVEIFDALDIDGGGSLDIEEFCEGLYHAAVSKVPVELKRIDKRVNMVCRMLADIGKTQDTLRDLVYQMGADVRMMRDQRGNSKSATASTTAIRLSGLAGDVPLEARRMVPNDSVGASPKSARDIKPATAQPRPHLPQITEQSNCGGGRSAPGVGILPSTKMADGPDFSVGIWPNAVRDIKPATAQAKPRLPHLAEVSNCGGGGGAPGGGGVPPGGTVDGKDGLRNVRPVVKEGSLEGISPKWRSSSQPTLPQDALTEVMGEPTCSFLVKDWGPLPVDTPSWALEVLREIRRLRTSQRGVSVHQTVTVTEGGPCDDDGSRLNRSRSRMRCRDPRTDDDSSFWPRRPPHGHLEEQPACRLAMGKVRLMKGRSSPWEAIQQTLEGTEEEIEKATELAALSMQLESSNARNRRQPIDHDVPLAQLGCAAQMAPVEDSIVVDGVECTSNHDLASQEIPDPTSKWKPHGRGSMEACSPEALGMRACR